MKLIDLYKRVVETTGLDILTEDSLIVAIANCFADLTSRGYRRFKEATITEFENKGNNMIEFPLPSDLRKTLYCKVAIGNRVYNGVRVALNNPHVTSKVVGNGEIRSNLTALNLPVIFYIKDDKVIVEWISANTLPTKILFGYYAKLEAPVLALDTDTDIDDIEIDIRKEFEDAVVVYCCYFYYSRYYKDNEKIYLFLNNYKYYVEDILHHLAYEDSYNDDEEVVVEYGEY